MGTYSSLTQRPPEFELNPYSSLATGLVFAGLGRVARSTHYRDSSPYGNHGTLTNMDPTDWVWDGTLNRFVLDFVREEENYVALPTKLLSYDFSVSIWYYHPAEGTPDTIWSVYSAVTDTGRTRFTITAGNLNSFQVGGTADAASGDAILGAWTHVVLCRTGAACKSYINGVLNTSMSISDADQVGQTVPFYLARSAVSSATYSTLSCADLLIHNRELSLGEIQQIADPSNVMYSGLILPPRRRLWAVSGGAPPANYLLTLRAANKRGNKMGGTLLGKQS